MGGVLYYAGTKRSDAVAAGNLAIPSMTRTEAMAGDSEISRAAGDSEPHLEKSGASATRNRQIWTGKKTISATSFRNAASTAPRPDAQGAPPEDFAGTNRYSSDPSGTPAAKSHAAIAPEGDKTKTREVRAHSPHPAGPAGMLAGTPISLQKKINPGLHLHGTNEAVCKTGVSIGAMASQLILAGAPAGGKSIIGFQAGVVMEIALKYGWVVSSGLQYQRRTGTFEASKMTETRSYRFGLELAEEQLLPSSVHYIVLPLKLGWQRQRHFLEGGISLHFLVGLRGARGSLERTGDLPPRKEFVPHKMDGLQKMVTKNGTLRLRRGTVTG